MAKCIGRVVGIYYARVTGNDFINYAQLAVFDGIGDLHKKYKHHDRFKVYSTEHIEDTRFVKYIDQTERIKDAYYKLAKPMFDIKMLKDSIEE